MSEHGTADSDLFRIWLDGSRAFLNASRGPAAGWQGAERMFATWSRFAEAFAAEHRARHGGPGESPFDPAGWLRAEGGGGMADLWRWMEGPDLADLFQGERTAIRETREWAAWLAALEQFRTVVGDGWMRAFKQFVRRLSTIYERDKGEERKDPDWTELVSIWREIADAEMARTHRSESFLAAQRDLIAAQIDLRQSLRARIERFSEFLGIPTRAEVDDLHRMLHEMRREITRLRAAGNGRGPAGR